MRKHVVAIVKFYVTVLSFLEEIIAITVCLYRSRGKQPSQFDVKTSWEKDMSSPFSQRMFFEVKF